MKRKSAKAADPESDSNSDQETEPFNINSYDQDSESDSDGPPEESASNSSHPKKRGKHAPAESSSKKPVSVIRKTVTVPKKQSSLYSDIRFDPLYGKADLHKTRKNYDFLNQYREQELKEMRERLKKTKNPAEKEELQKNIQSTQSRLDTLKNRDFEHKVLTEKRKELKGKGYYLKNSDARKLVLEEKFKTMKSRDVEKALKRKRKKNAAKERKNMPMVRRTG